MIRLLHNFDDIHPSEALRQEEIWLELLAKNTKSKVDAGWCDSQSVRPQDSGDGGYSLQYVNVGTGPFIVGFQHMAYSMSL